MKLHSDDSGAAGRRITAYGAGFVAVGGVPFTATILLGEGELATDFEECEPGDLSPATVARLRAFDPEVVVVGTGARHVFPPCGLFAPLIREGIGVEIMSTPAACRTYNVLSGEGRKVVALLLPIAEERR